MTGWLPRSQRANPIDLLAVDPSDKRANGAEQDQAAGGRDQRLLTRADGSTTLAVVRARIRTDHQSARVYAVLRWARVPGDPHEHWIGRVDERVRIKALTHAWRQVHEHGLLTVEGRAKHRASRRR